MPKSRRAQCQASLKKEFSRKPRKETFCKRGLERPTKMDLRIWTSSKLFPLVNFFLAKFPLIYCLGWFKRFATVTLGSLGVFSREFHLGQTEVRKNGARFWEGLKKNIANFLSSDVLSVKAMCVLRCCVLCWSVMREVFLLRCSSVGRASFKVE